VAIGHLSSVKSLSTDIGDSFALLNNGTVLGWGYTRNRSLGPGISRDATCTGDPCRLSPERVLDLSHVDSLVAFNGEVFALRDNGTVWTWAPYNELQLTKVAGLSNVKAIAPFLALLRNGTVMTWSYTNTGQQIMPESIPDLAGVVAICNGRFALLSDGTVVGWDINSQGLPEKAEPVSGLSDVRAISCYGNDNLALRSDGTVMTFAADTTAAQITGLAHVKAISVAAEQSDDLALLQDGRVMAWGSQGQGDLGNGTFGSSTVPVPVCAVGATSCTSSTNELTGVKAIAAGGVNLALLASP
jgi:alpha-tubulin suppressor-like RCC1 family protein